ncbi:ABC transporter ATP-binding protein [Candidatus Hodarchaeum mangrovi]
MKIPFVKFYTLLYRYLNPYRKLFIFLLILLCCDILFSVLIPQIIRYYINSFDLLDRGLITPQRILNRLFDAAILYIGLGAVQQTLYIISVYLTQVLAWKSTNQLRSDVCKKCIDLDMTFHNEYTPGKMIERIDGDVTTLAHFFSQFSLLVVMNFVLICAILFTLFLEDWRIGTVFTLFTILTMLILYRIWNYASPYWKKVRDSTTELFAFIEEAISGKEDIKANGADLYIMKRFHDHSKDEFLKWEKAVIISRLIHVGIMGIIAIGTTLVFVVGVPLFEQRIIDFGTFFLINAYVGLLIDPIIRIVRESQDLTQADASINRINEIFTFQSKISDTGNQPFPTTSSLELEFSNIFFSYSKADITLNDISFKLKAGKKLGVIGRTGSGKTTLSRLLFRLFDPDSGTISLNGMVNIKNLPLKDLRQNIAYVTQQVELFKASLRDNISFFNPKISDTQILQIIHELKLTEWYNQLPEGLNTELLSGESGFSAGEAQLIALTRVFLKNPRVVILDEASSRLDPVTENLIDQAISRLLKERTSIIIAHRLSTLEEVDEILLLEKGEIVEYGAREELKQDPNSKYSQLLKTGLQEVLA